MFIHDHIKILYSGLGYLPNNPYYLISDTEMIEAFRNEEIGFFNDMYPCPGDELSEPYETLKASIWEKLDNYLADPQNYIIPDWVYAFMIKRPTTFSSPEEDIAYMYDLTGVKSVTMLAEFSPELAYGCYLASQEWLRKRPSQFKDRPPTVFGEAHVEKCLRLKQANILIETEPV